MPWSLYTPHFFRLSAYHQFYENNRNDGLLGIVLYRLRRLGLNFIEPLSHTIQLSKTESTNSNVKSFRKCSYDISFYCTIYSLGNLKGFNYD